MSKAVQFRLEDNVYQEAAEIAEFNKVNVNVLARTSFIEYILKDVQAERDAVMEKEAQNTEKLQELEKYGVDKVIDKLKAKEYPDDVIKQMFEQFGEQVYNMPEFSPRRSGADWGA